MSMYEENCDDLDESLDTETTNIESNDYSNFGTDAIEICSIIQKFCISNGWNPNFNLKNVMNFLSD